MRAPCLKRCAGAGAPLSKARQNGSDALARLIELRPYVSLVDIGLPGIGGYELARRVNARKRTRAPAVPAW